MQIFLFLLVAAISFAQNSLSYAIVWAEFGGFGGISKEYTAHGEIGASILFGILPLILLCIFVCRLLALRRRNTGRKSYAMELFRF